MTLRKRGYVGLVEFDDGGQRGVEGALESVQRAAWGVVEGGVVRADVAGGREAHGGVGLA